MVKFLWVSSNKLNVIFIILYIMALEDVLCRGHTTETF